MARFPRHAVSCGGLLGSARAAFPGTRVAASGADLCAHDSHRDHESPRLFQDHAHVDLRRARPDHRVDDRLAHLPYSRNPLPSRNAQGAITLSPGVVGHQHPGLRLVVLEAGRWRPFRPRSFSLQDLQCVSLPATCERPRALWRLVAPVSRLSICCIQHKHGLFPNRHCCSVAMGQVGNHAAIAHLPLDSRPARCPGCEHSVEDTLVAPLVWTGDRCEAYFEVALCAKTGSLTAANLLKLFGLLDSLKMSSLEIALSTHFAKPAVCNPYSGFRASWPFDHGILDVCVCHSAIYHRANQNRQGSSGGTWYRQDHAIWPAVLCNSHGRFWF